ncbi:hypothetical protein BCV72DRAFT_336368 [Rhizopus microsporus var. microsporus]|uniref:Uncharacterized protein n=2 Tax=Rhizopus microsporus TaxID=58291 RepID=A0A2G4SQ12_RHIZD|nr:uncharacterized protein RHIMIDRAFT_293081 [Rhizopus microsporus ATCC 52813]ORE05770.1 hypothetical protein BCV72DRAFT_336368 [Rhizopus microsporus var. microsporus]PHZ10864.1 hypothetical protein RHIMIDRAFT_293081 [Rhizopus microsporus ATCC 52813]
MDLKYAQQIDSYEVTKINTAYLNRVFFHFGNKLRMFLNMILKKDERIKAVKNKMKKDSGSEEKVSAIVKTIVEQCNKVKMYVSSRKINDLPRDLLSSQDVDIIHDIFSSYPLNYQFVKGLIYYDCKANALKHLKAFYKISSMCEILQEKSFNCFPLRRIFIPSYMTIDTLILNTQILKNPVTSHLDKEIVWASVLNVAAKAMKPQGERRTMKFRGMLFTDGVGVSVLKQNDDMKKGGSGAGRRAKAVDEEDFKYIEKLEKEELLAGVGKCVSIDPGRRDMLCCMHKESTIENKRTYRYTSNQRAIETKSRKFKKLRENLKPDDVRTVEVSLSKCKSSTANGGKFAKYLQKRATVTPVLSKYYANEDIPAVETNLLPFRKMKLSSFINGQQADKRLARNLRTKFGDDTTLIIGNWSSGNVKFHEPIRDVRMRRMLAKQGFKIYFLDEFKTSSLCPSCLSGKLESSKMYKIQDLSREKSNQLCKNQQCLEATSGTIPRHRL